LGTTRSVVKTTDPWADGVQSIAALKALPASYRAGVVTVLGYHAAGDGGGGPFFFDDAASVADNGGTVIAPTSGTGRWIRLS
jgi:hypothetical protein